MKNNKKTNDFLVGIFTIFLIAIFIGNLGDFIYNQTGMTLALSLIELEQSIFLFFPLVVAATFPNFLLKKGDVVAMISGIISYVILTEILNPKTLQSAFYNTNYNVDISFFYISNIFLGVLCGLLASYVFNKHHMIKLPSWLSFFSGRRSIPIITSFYTMLLSFLLYYLWPIIYQMFLWVPQLLNTSKMNDVFYYSSIFGVSIFLLNICWHYKNIYDCLFSFIIIFCITVNPVQPNINVLLFLFSPLLCLIYTASIAISIVLPNLSYWQIGFFYLIIYYFASLYHIRKNWSPLFFFKDDINLPSNDVLHMAINAIGDFENIKNTQVYNNYLVITVYEMDFVDTKMFKHLTGWTINLESEFELYISSDINPHIIMHTLMTLKEENNKLLLI